MESRNPSGAIVYAFAVSTAIIMALVFSVAYSVVHNDFTVFKYAVVLVFAVLPIISIFVSIGFLFISSNKLSSALAIVLSVLTLMSTAYVYSNRSAIVENVRTQVTEQVKTEVTNEIKQQLDSAKDTTKDYLDTILKGIL